MSSVDDEGARLALDAPDRLSALHGKVVDRELDPELQAIVESVRAELDFPIALVSLILRRTQLFRAHVGLPAELQVTRGTDRSLSFCQHVAATGRPLEVPDALGHPELPQELVHLYGIRSYIGLPLRVSGQVLGTLCALDVRPRAFTDGERARLDELATRAAGRLAELASESPGPQDLVAHAVHPAFLEIRNLLNVLLGDISLLGLALADVGAVLDLVRGGERPLTREERDRALGVLGQALDANQDLAVTHARLEHVGATLARYLLALEQSLAPGDEAVRVGDVVQLADGVATHVTRTVGGVRWDVADPDLLVLGSKISVVSAIAAALRLVAEGLGAGAARGIDARVAHDDGTATLHVAAPEARHGLYESVCETLRTCAQGGIGATVAASASCVTMSWPKRRARGRRRRLGSTAPPAS